MTGPELLQFEAIRTVAAALISVSIVLLWLVAITGARTPPVLSWRRDHQWASRDRRKRGG